VSIFRCAKTIIHLEQYFQLTSAAAVGLALGNAEGLALGAAVGDAEGLAVGDAEGEAEGDALGEADGLAVGLADGAVDGAALGEAEGEAEGRALGEAEGETEGMGIMLSELVACNNRSQYATSSLKSLPVLSCFASSLLVTSSPTRFRMYPKGLALTERETDAINMRLVEKRMVYRCFLRYDPPCLLF
jgi:hypothetical protein